MELSCLMSAWVFAPASPSPPVRNSSKPKGGNREFAWKGEDARARAVVPQTGHECVFELVRFHFSSVSSCRKKNRPRELQNSCVLPFSTNPVFSTLTPNPFNRKCGQRATSVVSCSLVRRSTCQDRLFSAGALVRQPWVRQAGTVIDFPVQENQSF
ncbi:hypothetical protein TGMAS_267630 [Toxoplasma gondii MAS]|uniref:Uncharacterized protein n=2 Tax=Toxoplasma gondii TaxID=5811 RepID=A0A086QM73_TOXGO|nr:hypothetical protein TGMAS_267630 [Toxoplasma gondii MAS]PUA85441.1 hypothetical protein TGBR9_267630 [Toxoplasma gondii TgCATBr9]